MSNPNEHDISSTLEGNIDLLTKSDMWLDQKRVTLSQKVSILCDELQKITDASFIKRRLQQTNKVPVVNNGSIEIMDLKSAISNFGQSTQANTWELDGYDTSIINY